MIEPIRVVRTAPLATAFIPLEISRSRIREVMGPALMQLRAAVAAQGVAIAGPWFTRHKRDPGEIFDFEIHVPVASAVTPAGRILPGQREAMDLVQTTYHGGYEGLGQAWGAFLAEIRAAGHRVNDGLWERYLVDPATSQDASAWRTELSKQIAPA